MTRKEILQQLLNGARVSKFTWASDSSPHKYIEYDANMLMTLVFKDGLVQPHNEVFFDPTEWEIYSTPEWFDNIPPQGRICYVDSNVIDIIYGYNHATRMFAGLYKQYTSANPLIPSEIDMLFVNP